MMKQCKYCSIEFKPRISKQVTCSSKKCLQEYKNEWGRNNPACKKAWLERNPEKRKQSSAEYQKRNWQYYNQYSRLYAARLLQAKPKWLNELDELYLEEIYDLARRRNLEVDHIIPLKGKFVCGLHVPCNLQLLTRSQNAKKSNKVEDIVMVWENV